MNLKSEFWLVTNPHNMRHTLANSRYIDRPELKVRVNNFKLSLPVQRRDNCSNQEVNFKLTDLLILGWACIIFSRLH